MKTILLFTLFTLLSFPCFCNESYHSNLKRINEFLNLDDKTEFKTYSYLINYRPEGLYWILHTPGEQAIDPTLGYINKPNTQSRHIARTEDRVLYDAIYTVDNFGRRTCKVSAPKKRQSFMAFFGCSFTFGIAINDDETIAAHVAQNSSKYFPYNYAVGGSAANAMLALLQNRDLKSEISQEEGALVYVYINDHINRANGKLPSLTWYKDSPYYDDIDGKLVRNQSLLKGPSLKSKALLFLNDWFPPIRGKVFPPLTNGDVDYFCRLVTESRDEFIKKFPTSKFIFYVHPFEPAPNKKLLSCLEKHQISVYFGQNINWNTPALVVPIDGHPTTNLNKQIADQLLDFLQ